MPPGGAFGISPDESEAWGGTMPENSPAAPAIDASQSANDPQRRSNRNLWILTGYLASGLALLGVFAYYFAAYVTH